MTEVWRTETSLVIASSLPGRERGRLHACLVPTSRCHARCVVPRESFVSLSLSVINSEFPLRLSLSDRVRLTKGDSSAAGRGRISLEGYKFPRSLIVVNPDEALSSSSSSSWRVSLFRLGTIFLNRSPLLSSLFLSPPPKKGLSEKP